MPRPPSSSRPPAPKPPLPKPPAPKPPAPKPPAPKPPVAKWNINDGIKQLTTDAKSAPQGKCATHVRRALEAGGINTIGRPRDAKDYGAFLLEKGFKEIPTKGYAPAKGDIVVLQPYRGGSSSGHIAVYSGTEWISDFRQKDFWGGPGYRNNKVPHASRLLSSLGAPDISNGDVDNPRNT